MKNNTDEELLKLIQEKKDSKAFIEMLTRYRPLILSKISALKAFHYGSILSHEDILRILEYTFAKLLYKYPVDDEIIFSKWISLRLLHRSYKFGRSIKKTRNSFKEELYSFDDSYIPIIKKN